MSEWSRHLWNLLNDVLYLVHALWSRSEDCLTLKQHWHSLKIIATSDISFFNVSAIADYGRYDFMNWNFSWSRLILFMNVQLKAIFCSVYFDKNKNFASSLLCYSSGNVLEVYSAHTNDFNEFKIQSYLMSKETFAIFLLSLYINAIFPHVPLFYQETCRT